MSPHETLLRAVPNVGGHVANGKVVVDAAFEPRKDVDDDGLSLFRLDFITPEQLAEANAHKAGVYCVFLQADRLLEMSMTLQPLPDQLPGHVVIPQITYPLFRDAKTKSNVKDHMIHMRLQANRAPLWGPSRPKQ